MPATTVAHKAFVHRVKIIVVPPEALNGLSPPGTESELTGEVLDRAAIYVKSTAPEVMGDPHTIVAIGAQVATPLDDRLLPHDHAVDHSMVRLWTESDVIEWEADRPFVVLSVRKAERTRHTQPGSPEMPFYVPPPYASDAQHVVRSSIARFEANRQQYKATIRIGGQTIDPDILCGSPP